MTETTRRKDGTFLPGMSPGRTKGSATKVLGMPVNRRKWTPLQLKLELISGFMAEYEDIGQAAWRILARENPEAFLRLGAYLCPKKIDVFTSGSDIQELDDMIALLRNYLHGKTIESKLEPIEKPMLIERKA